MTSKLPPHEWCIVVLFCSILLMLSAFAIRGQNAAPPLPVIKIAEDVLEVNIKGQVANPGVHFLPLKSTMKDLLEIAEPLSTADLSGLNRRRKLRDGQTVQIPERRPITIQVKGMVKNPGPLQILSGTRKQDLAAQLEVLPEADLKSLKRRKSFLFDGDTIEVPAKKVRPRKAKTP